MSAASTSARGESSLSVGSGTNVSTTSTVMGASTNAGMGTGELILPDYLMMNAASTSARGESSLSVGSGTNVSITSAGMRSGKSILSGGSSGMNAADTIAGMGARELTLSDGSETDTIAGMGAGELTLSNGSETYAASAGMGAGEWRSSDVVDQVWLPTLPPHVVGLAHHVAIMRQQLQHTRVMGILGMGGIGKTTLAKQVFHEIHKNYNVCSFLMDVKSRPIVEVEHQLLHDLGYGKGDDYDFNTLNVEYLDFPTILSQQLYGRKVLVVVDNVEIHHKEFILSLLQCHGFGNGSNFILTGHDWEAMNGLIDDGNKIEMEPLQHSKALELFDSHAFLKERVPHIHELSSIREKIVCACSGLPLSLKVLGGFLNGENFIPVWRDALTRLQNAQRLQEDDMLWRTLHISINELEPIEREMLFNVAMFFSNTIGEEKGTKVKTALEIWKHDLCETPNIVLKRLMDKSLLKVGEHGQLVMHDLVRNMCQRIVTEQFMDGTRDHYSASRVQNLPSQLLDVSKANPSRASSLIRAFFRTHPSQRQASSLIQALFRTHPITAACANPDDFDFDQCSQSSDDFVFAPLRDDTRDYFDLSVMVISRVKFLISEQILCDWSSPKRFLRLNKLQCEHLASKLEETQAYLQTRQFLPWHVTYGAAFKQLYYILKKAETLVTKCCSEEWLLEAVSLMGTKEDVVDIILDLQWATKVVQIAILEFEEGRSSKLAQLQEAGKAYEDLIHSFQHDALQNEVLEDKHMLVTKLQEVKTRHGGNDDVAYKSDYLLHRLGHSIQSSDDPPHFWPPWKPPEFERVQIGDLDQESLSHNCRGMVIRVKWLGKDFALKRLTQSSTTAEAKEAIILAANQHPHVVQLMCHWNKRTNYFITYMLMEKMDGDISKLMDQRTAQDIVPPFSLLESVDIMLQVAKAMCFLHSKQVAHRDLKCQNILWKHGQFDQLVVKLGDFGEAKTDVKNSTMNQQQTWLVGTTGWRAPELSGKHMLTHKRYPLMADVFSFGMTFLEILTGEIPFVGEKRMNIQPRIDAGDRPDLPNECPPFLAFLIQSCWDANPRARPMFQQICMMLMHGKNLLMGMTFYENEDSIFAYTSLDGTLKCLKDVKHIMPRGYCAGNSPSSENDIEGCQVTCNPTGDHVKDCIVNLNPNEEIVQSRAESSLREVNYNPNEADVKDCEVNFNQNEDAVKSRADCSLRGILGTFICRKGHRRRLQKQQ